MVDTQLRVYNHLRRSSTGKSATYLHPRVGGGGVELPGTQRVPDGLSALSASGFADDEQFSGVAGGDFNARFKSKQKYWNRGAGAEGILQVRAAYLSEDGRLQRYFAQRPGNPYRRRAA